MGVSPTTRNKVFRRDGWHCHYCDEKLWPSSQATVDHKVAQSRGGSDDLENLVACCFACNNAKGSMGYDLFVSIRDEVGYGVGSNEILEKVAALWHRRFSNSGKPAMEWCAVLAGCG
jgi:hypothetical protein